MSKSRPRRRFRTPVFPCDPFNQQDVLYRVFCDWICEDLVIPGQEYRLFQSVLLAPHLPRSLIPRYVQQHYRISLLSLGQPRFRLPFWHNIAGESYSARLIFSRTSPRRLPLRVRLFDLGVLLPDSDPSAPPQREALLGADFLLENRFRLCINYGRIQNRQRLMLPSPIAITQMDSNTPCGFLEYPD